MKNLTSVLIISMGMSLSAMSAVCHAETRAARPATPPATTQPVSLTDIIQRLHPSESAEPTLLQSLQSAQQKDGGQQ